MNETCDRCGPAVRAAYRVDRDSELYLCGHCTNRLWTALCAQGWNIWPAGEYALAPQAT
jgi:ribosomal protein S27AE